MFNFNWLKKYITGKSERADTLKKESRNLENTEVPKESAKDSEELDNLKKSLERCHQAAKEGIEASIKQTKNIKSIMDSIIECNKKFDFSSDSLKIPKECIEYKEELKDVQNQLNEIYIPMTEKLEQYKDKLSHFTITVYGKTMVGKSTLMEVLKEGNGSSIGKGTQRTTRDVREYVWKETGVKFVDVPGIGAAIAGGDKDERIAFEAAKCADLILFLITDDGPQKEEAQAFAKVKELGKPMVCILNVKASGISKSISMKLRIRNVTKRMAETADFENIRKQFYQYAIEFGQDWSDVPFLYADLNSAWLSQQEQDTEIKELLCELSQVKPLKQAIANQINQRGAFYQFKTPMDIVYHGLLETSDKVFNQYGESAYLIDQLENQIKELRKVAESYNIESISIIDNICQHMFNDLNDAALRFADEHFADKNAGENWKKTVENLKLDKQITDTLMELQENRNRVLEQFSRHIPTMSFSFRKLSGQAGIQGDDPVDTRFLANSVSALIGVGLSLTPIGWVAGTLFAISSLCFGNAFTDKREEKIKKRKSQMYDDLFTWIAGPENRQEGERPECFMTTLEDVLWENYEKIRQVFCSTKDDIQGYMKNISDMNSAQLSIWKQMNNTLKSINVTVMRRAFNDLSENGLTNSYPGFARIPGQATLISLPAGYVLSDNVVQKLKIIMQEPIYVFDPQHLSISQAIKKIGNLSDNEIDIFNVGKIELIGAENKVAERVYELRYNKREFVPDDLKIRAHTIEVICRLVSQLYNYPIFSYTDNEEEV